MFTRFFLFIIVALWCLISAAEEINIPIPLGQQSLELQNTPRPSHGMMQSQVRTQFGEPLEQTTPVGRPPITRWDYDIFSVYFEYDHVIHTVLHMTTPVPSSIPVETTTPTASTTPLAK